jgi:hypothetical protein
MVNSSPELKQVIKVHKHSLFVESTATKFEALSSDAKSLDGLNPQCVLINKQFESVGVRFDASSQTLLKSKTFASLKVQTTAQPLYPLSVLLGDRRRANWALHDDFRRRSRRRDI